MRSHDTAVLGGLRIGNTGLKYVRDVKAGPGLIRSAGALEFTERILTHIY